MQEEDTEDTEVCRLNVTDSMSRKVDAEHIGHSAICMQNLAMPALTPELGGWYAGTVIGVLAYPYARVCSSCLKEADHLTACAGCDLTRYCGTVCRVHHWFEGRHREVCGADLLLPARGLDFRALDWRSALHDRMVKIGVGASRDDAEHNWHLLSLARQSILFAWRGTQVVNWGVVDKERVVLHAGLKVYIVAGQKDEWLTLIGPKTARDVLSSILYMTTTRTTAAPADETVSSTKSATAATDCTTTVTNRRTPANRQSSRTHDGASSADPGGNTEHSIVSPPSNCRGCPLQAISGVEPLCMQTDGTPIYLALWSRPMCRAGVDEGLNRLHAAWCTPEAAVNIPTWQRERERPLKSG